MSTKTRKNQGKPQAKPVAARVEKNKKQLPLLTGGDVLPLSLILLYLIVDFIPRFEAADVMGAQWIYLIILNLLSAVYIFVARKKISEALVSVGKNSLTILFTVLYVLAGLSILVAMNKIEALICYSRFSASFFAFLSMAVFLYNRPNAFKLLAQVLSAFLIYQSLNLLSQFFAGFDSMPMTQLLDSLKSNSGNKNIMAASLVMKIPFAIYCICTQKLFGKLVNLIALSLGALTILFINARASYLSLILVSVIFLAYIIYEFVRDRNKKTLAVRASLVYVPIIAMFVFSNLVLQTKVEYASESGGQSSYGSVTDRLKTLSLEQQKGSLRMHQYKSALQHIKSNPLMGTGFGNWKLASIPYERSFSDEMFISYHVHNDFLEHGAELGIPGGLLYLSLYVTMLVFSLKVISSRTVTRQLKQMAAFSLMALSTYFIDAMFNFPLERPIMQIYLAFILALQVNIFLQYRNQSGTQKKYPWTAPVFAVLAFLILAPAFYFSRQVYISMSGQALYNADMLSGTPVYKSEQVIPALPEIPDLNVFGFPIPAIKARYLLNEKKYDSALAYLNASAHINPYISYTEFLKGNLFLEIGKIDSAYFYSRKAFFMKPRAKSNYQLFLQVLSRTKDSAMATQAFRETRQYRDEPWVWNDYINTLYMCGKDFKTLYLLADSAAKKFPEDADLKRKQAELAQFQNTPR